MDRMELSKGRLVLGIGIGDYPGDFRVMGINYQNRNGLLDEYIDVLDAIFRGGQTNFQGKTIYICLKVFKVDSY